LSFAFFWDFFLKQLEFEFESGVWDIIQRVQKLLMFSFFLKTTSTLEKFEANLANHTSIFYELLEVPWDSNEESTSERY
jgi:hypothetical protein